MGTCPWVLILVSVQFVSMCSFQQPTCLKSPPKLQSMSFWSIPQRGCNSLSFSQPQNGGDKGKSAKVSFFCPLTPPLLILVSRVDFDLAAYVFHGLACRFVFDLLMACRIVTTKLGIHPRWELFKLFVYDMLTTGTAIFNKAIFCPRKWRQEWLLLARPKCQFFLNLSFTEGLSCWLYI